MSAPVAAAKPSQPFRGIEEFRFIDQGIFPSRAVQVQRLLRLVTMYRGVLLYGDSGVGKSSLINAGLIPAAIEDGFAPERIRIDPRPGAEIIVERISLTEKDDPPYLPSRFAKNEKSRRVTLSVEEFEKNVRAAAAENNPGAYPLLIFDQFEEILTLVEQKRAKHGAVPEKAQESIIATLLAILADGSIPVKILFSFREDFLAKLTRIFSRHPNLNDQFLRLDPLTIDRFPTIIRTPFERGDFPNPLPDEVMVDLEEQFRKRGDTNLLILSEVQIAALLLWRSDDPKALLASRGVAGLIESYFSEAIKALGLLQQPAVLLLNRMVTSSDTRNVVSRDDLLRDVAAQEKIKSGTLEHALKALEKGRVIRGEKRSNVVVYEIVSEYLVPWIVRKRAELIAEKRRREFIEEENKRYVEEIEQRAQRRWQRNIRIYQTVLAAAAILIVASFFYNELNSNRVLIKKLEDAAAQIKTLQQTTTEQKTRIQALEAELGSANGRLEVLRKTNQDLNETRRSLQLMAEQAETAREDLQRRLRAALARATPPQPNTTTTGTSTQP